MASKRKDQICSLLEGIETGDEAALVVVNQDKCVQHNPQTHEGSEAWRRSESSRGRDHGRGDHAEPGPKSDKRDAYGLAEKLRLGNPRLVLAELLDAARRPPSGCIHIHRYQG